MRLLLTSQGIAATMADAILTGWEWDIRGKKVLHVRTAALVEDNQGVWIDPQLAELAKLECAVTDIDISAYRPDDIAMLLAAHDVIYMQGGDTFFLRRHLAISGAFGLINKAVRSDEIAYVGTSAGSIIAGAGMLLAGYRCSPQELVYKPGCPEDAFRFVDAHFHVHTKDGDDVKVRQVFPALDRPLVMLRDGEGWLVDRNGAGRLVS